MGRLVIVAIVGMLIGSACGRIGFESVPRAGDDGGDDSDATVGDGAKSDGATDGQTINCAYMNCPMGSTTCCVGAARTCEADGTCAGVEAECNLANGQGCPTNPAQVCCPLGGGSHCTPAACV